MKIHEALRAIDPRVNFEKGRPVLEVEFCDDYDNTHKVNAYLEQSFFDKLKGKQVQWYEAKAKQYGDMIIIAIEKGEYNESYTLINNTIIDHETYNPSQFFSFTHYAKLKQDYYRTI